MQLNAHVKTVNITFPLTMQISVCPLLAATINGDHPLLDCLLTANWIWPEWRLARISFRTLTLPSDAQ